MARTTAAGMEFDYADVLGGQADEKDVLTSGPGLSLDVYVYSGGTGQFLGGNLRVYGRVGVDNTQWILLDEFNFQDNHKGLAMSVRGAASSFRITMQGGQKAEGAEQNRARVAYGLSHCGAPVVALKPLALTVKGRSDWQWRTANGSAALAFGACVVRQVYGFLMAAAPGDGYAQLWDGDDLLDWCPCAALNDYFEFQYVGDGSGVAGRETVGVGSLDVVISSTPTTRTPIAIGFSVTYELRKTLEGVS